MALPALPAQPDTDAMMDIFVARQPIFDAREQVVGYELLYRGNGEAQHAAGANPHAMSTQVLVNAFLGIGIREMTGTAPGFVNFTREQLLDDLWQLLDPTTVVVELLGGMALDDEVLSACERLVAGGYRFAIDAERYDPSLDRVLALHPIVKVDVLDRPVDELTETVGQLRARGVQTLAERVETVEMRDECLLLGFELFQGYFFSRPETITKKEPAVGQLAILRLLNQLRDPAVRDIELEQSFGSDLTLCYKLLRLVNSAASGSRGIESIGHAVRLIGRVSLHRWLALLLVSSLAEEGGARVELAAQAMTRARLCELLLTHGRPQRDHGPGFMVGLFSLLDVMMRMPMQDIVGRVELAPEVRSALVERDGPLAGALFMVEAYERAHWDAVLTHSRQLAVPPKELAAMYLESVRWARERLAIS